MITAEYLIERFQLEPLSIEGGFWRRVYTAEETIPPSALPERYTAMEKPFCSGIYYLLTPDTCSLLHLLKTDDYYHFYLGDPLTILLLFPNGSHQVRTMGNDLEAGHELHLVAPRGVWTGSVLQPGGRFALVGTSISPGFDATDFTLGDRRILQAAYPAASDLIERLTPEHVQPLLDAWPEKAAKIKVQGRE
jgi:predicted cupin superfamily sugar epimerase